MGSRSATESKSELENSNHHPEMAIVFKNILMMLFVKSFSQNSSFSQFKKEQQAELLSFGQVFQRGNQQ